MSNTLASAASDVSHASGAQYEGPTLPAQTARAFSCDRLVPQLVSDQAIQNPRRIALVDDSMELTYGELDARAERLGDHLQAMGVGANVVVAVCIRRSALAAVASLAVLKAGGAYLPIDPKYPRERLSFILADSNTPIVLSDSTVAGGLPEGNWRLIFLDRNIECEPVNGGASHISPSHLSPSHLAYVIYTSGSTGTPKGVEITHENLLNLVFWHRKAFAVSADDRAMQFASFGFDAAVWELWPHLTAGVAVHTTPDEVRTSPELLRNWLVDHEITIGFVPTVMAERLIVLDWPVTTKLRLLLTGADTLHHYPRPGLPFALINNYGPTECTVVTTCALVGSARKDHEQRPPIGRPIDGAEIHIVDESLNPVPRGDVGEIYIGGAGVGRGYRNSPELTAKKFVRDPFGNGQGARLYRTGDLARWLPDGQIEYVGRTDNLIKLRGHRIEPNEIVSVLNTHPAVEASAVLAQDDERKASAENLRLFAYLVIRQAQAPPNASELRNLLSVRLPDYMVPAVFLTVRELPFNANGKLDREALRACENCEKLPDDTYSPPQTVLEGKLTAIVAELLGVDRVGINDNFFLIGGHSLFGTQLIARIRDSFGVDLPLRSIFESPAPAQLARQIERLVAKKIGGMSADEVQHALKQSNFSGGQQ